MTLSLNERVARLHTDLLMAINYEYFISSLKRWAETSTIQRVKPLVSIVSQLNYPIKSTTADTKVKQRNYTQGVRTWKNVNRLFNRKLTPFYALGLPQNWMEPSIYEDFVGHFDDNTKFMFEKHCEKYKADKGSPVPYGASHLETHPFERYGKFETAWIDANGNSLQDYKDEANINLLDAAENNKDSDYVNKSAAAYLSAKSYHLPFLNMVPGYDTPLIATTEFGWDYLINEWKPLFTSSIKSSCSKLFNVESMQRVTEEEIMTIYQPLYDRIKKQEELLDLEDLLKEMSILLEVFNIYELDLKLNTFRIKSVYMDDGIDEEGMNEEWVNSIREDLSGDELERFDDDPSDYINENGYEIGDYINEFTWDDPELVRNHANQVLWEWNRNEATGTLMPGTNTIEIDGEQMSNFVYAPSPFSKQYIPLKVPRAPNGLSSWEEPKNNLTGMGWGEYAYPNIYLDSPMVNENPPSLSSPFIPFQLPLDIRRLRYLVGSPLTNREGAGGILITPQLIEGVDLSEPFINMNISAGYGMLSINLLGHRQDRYEPIIPVDEDKYGESIPGAEPKIPKFEEESMGLHYFDISIDVKFDNTTAHIINYVHTIPRIIHKLSTN